MRTLLECKWALQIIKNLAEGLKRPSELLKNISGLLERVLYHRLKALESKGIIGKESNNKYPLKTFYYLNDKEPLQPLVSLLSKLEETNKIENILGSKWLLLLLNHPKRPSSPKELLLVLPGISEKVLYENLNYLIALGLIDRIVKATKPVATLHGLNNKGEEFLPSLEYAKNIILSIWKKTKS